MKKSELQAAERYLTGLDSAMKEKLEFVKTQGNLFEHVVDSLVLKGRACKVIVDVFKRSAMQLSPTKKPKEDTIETRTWPKLSMFKETKQLHSQDYMRSICQEIEKSASGNSSCPDVYSSGTVVIQFEGGMLLQDGLASYCLDDSVMEIEVLSTDMNSQMECFNLSLSSRLKATVYLGIRDNSPEGFLRATDEDGQDFFCELNHFSILFLLREDKRRLAMEFASEYNSKESNSFEERTGDNHGDQQENQDDHHVEKTVGDVPSSVDSSDEPKNETGMFVLMNKANGVFFASEY